MLETFGRYQLIKKLATGGMGQVYLARQKGPVGFEKLVVVKRILPHLSEEEDFIEMFFDEARIAALLNHPNIAQIFDLGEVEGTYFIAMEYVHGESLRAVNAKANTSKGGIPFGLKLRVIADAAAGLDFAHRAKGAGGQPMSLIHRDVSPQNVLIAFNGGVKLIDFGVAKAAGKISTTLTGAIKGKYAYMSPEQARGEELDSRSDVFGLGTVFYELLTSSRLFKRETQTDTLKAVVGHKVAPPSTLVRVPKSVDAIVLKALAKKRNERFQTAGELQLAIEELLVKARIPATMAHLSAFMHELYEQELTNEKLEASQVEDDPRGGSKASARSKSAEGSRSSSKAADPSSRSSSRSAKGSAADLEARLTLVQKTDQTRGIAFNALLKLAPKASGETFQDGESYPTGTFLRVLFQAGELLSTTDSPNRAFTTLGGECLEALLRLPSGKALAQTTENLDAQWMLAPLLAQLDSLIAGGLRKVEETTSKSAILVFRRDPLPPAFHAGVIARAFERLKDAEARIDADRRVAETTTFHVRWD